MTVQDAFSKPCTQCCSCGKKEEKTQQPTRTDNYDVSWSSFTQDVTMHGIRYIHLSNTSLITKLIWLVVILVMVAYALIASYGFFTALQRKETITKLKSITGDQIPFPSIIICNHNAISRYKMSLMQAELHGVEHLFGDLYVGSPPQRNWSSAEYDDLNNMSHSELVDLIFRLSPTVDETIVGGLFAANPLNITEEFKSILTDMGPCFQFNKDGKWNTTFNSKWGGLYLALHTRVDDYFSSLVSAFDGFTIAIIEPGESVSMNNNGVLGATPGTFAYMSLTKKKVIRQPPPADGNTSICLDTSVSPNTLTTVANYSVGACILECLANFTVHQCGCRGLYDVALPGTEICKPDVLISCANPRKVDYRKMNCECKPTCKEVQYSTQTTIFNYPNKMFMVDKNYSEAQKEQIRENMMEMAIFYKSLSYDLVKEELAYGWMDAIANLGGTLGVCIGASLLTICEFIQFGIWKASLFFKRFKNKRSAAKVRVLPAVNQKTKRTFIARGDNS